MRTLNQNSRQVKTQAGYLRMERKLAACQLVAQQYSRSDVGNRAENQKQLHQEQSRGFGVRNARLRGQTNTIPGFPVRIMVHYQKPAESTNGVRTVYSEPLLRTECQQQAKWWKCTARIRPAILWRVTGTSLGREQTAEGC